MWKVICNRIIKEHIKINDQGYVDLFKDLDRSMQPCFEKHQIRNNSVFNVHLTNQAILRFKFFEWYTLLFFVTKDKEACVMSEGNYHNSNYYKLQLLEKELKKNDVHIGMDIPDTLIECMRNVEPGELITFSNEMSYACFNRNEGFLVMKKCCPASWGNMNIFDLYNKTQNYKLNPDNYKAIYNFYIDLLKNGAILSARKIDISTRPQEIINRYTSDINDEKIRKLQFGPFKVRVSRSVDNKKLLWYDDLGNRVSVTDVKIMIAWLNTTPIITDFIRKTETDDAVEDLYDAKVRAAIEKLYAAGRFKDAYHLIEEYCKSRGENLNVTLKTYNATKKGFEAVGFSFACKDNDVKVFKLQYENNDINNDILSISPAKIEDFEKICEDKKENYLAFVKDRIKENIKDIAQEDKIDIVAEVMAKQDIDSGKAFDSLGEYHKGESALISSYNEEIDRIKSFCEMSPEDRERAAIEQYNAKKQGKTAQKQEYQHKNREDSRDRADN